MASILRILVVTATLAAVTAHPELSRDELDEERWHTTFKDYATAPVGDFEAVGHAPTRFNEELTSEYWNANAQAALKEKRKQQQNTNVAKNVILFLGDGMSIPTLMAARTYMGQLNGVSGEEGKLHWENFPYTGLSKTYCVNAQTPDSACTATAYLTGVKANDGTIGVNAQVPYKNCQAMTNTSNHVTSIAEWALDGGKSAGIVTSARVTHASPAGAYANTAHRDWESDIDVKKFGFDPTVCKDIATQLMTERPGKDFQVILGGGRRGLLPNTTLDDEGTYGEREDGVDLIETWKQDKADRNSSHSYVWNRQGLREIIDNPEDHDYVLGLFEASHCQYHAQATPETEPTLAEMTEAAIKILRKNSNGFFLFVEGGRIDHAHHDTYARLALDETIELAAAVRIADELTDENDTLIVTTSDHAHTMNVAGYPARGTDILSIGGVGTDKLSYTTISYANGLGYKTPVNSTRFDISNDDLTALKHRYPSLVPLTAETHGADDVAIFARGPWSHLFTGTMEQNNIPHYMAYAACIGRGLKACT